MSENRPEHAQTTGSERPDLTAWRRRDQQRRSNVAQPHRNRKHYTRTRKHRHAGDG